MSQRVVVLGLGRGPAEREQLRTDNTSEAEDRGEGVAASVNGRIGVPSREMGNRAVSCEEEDCTQGMKRGYPADRQACPGRRSG